MTRTRKLVLWTAVAAVRLGGSAAVLPSLISGGCADYASAVSIKETGEYQNPALLKKAWALPVASAYQAGIEFQQNGSVCGLTSLANVLHSNKQPGNQETILQDTNFSTAMDTETCSMFC